MGAPRPGWGSHHERATAPLYHGVFTASLRKGNYHSLGQAQTMWRSSTPAPRRQTGIAVPDDLASRQRALQHL